MDTLVLNYKYFKKADKPIPKELTDALVLKAPEKYSYDENGNFKIIDCRIKSCSQRPLNSLEEAVRELRKAGKKVPQELGNELVSRKPEKYSYENGEFKIIDCRIKSCSQRPLNSLEDAVRELRKAGKKVPQELENELVSRKPEKYSYENGVFKILRKERAEQHNEAIIAKQKELADFATEKQIAGINLFAPKLSNGIYGLVWRHAGKEKTLMTRCGIYSPEVVLFDVLSGFAVVRVHGNFGTKLYVVDCEKGEVVKSLTGGFACVSYIAQNHELFGYEKIGAMSMLHIRGKNHKWTRESSAAPDSALAINALAKLNETVIIKPNGMCAAYSLVALPVELKAVVQPTEYKKESDTNQSDVTNLNVTIKSTESAPGIFYNDVFVNGQRIIQSHYNTSFKIFMNGKILGVRGRKGNEMAPMEPWKWRLFDTKLDEQMFKSTDAYVVAISEENYGIKLRFDDGKFVVLMTRQFKSASKKAFNLENVKKHLYGR